MQPPPPARKTVRFGIFEADLTLRELRKRGRPVKLQDQPFQVLALMLRRPGEVVTREELQRVLWSGDTFVEFDEGLNKAVQKLRQTLGDSADNPRFIETVPRKGYRFIAPVGSIEEDPARPEGTAGNFILGFPRTVWMLAAVMLLVAGALLFLWRPRNPVYGGESLLLTRLTSDAGLTYQPAISPDGNLLAYASDRAGNGNLDIWVQQIPRGEPVRITQGAGNSFEPSFSPDGRSIVFATDRDGGGIFIVSALGGQPRKLAGRGWRPRFSPDSAWVAYWSGSRADRSGQLYVAPTAGGQSRKVNLPAELHGGRSPIWTPDGKHLLFVTCFSSNPDWYVVPAGGGRPAKTGVAEIFRRHGLSTGDAILPTPEPEIWLAGGRSVVFSARSGDSTDLWKISISPGDWHVAGPPERLTIASGLYRHASASAGGRIVFASLTRRTGIWQLPIDANRAKVTGALQRLTNGTGDDFSPSVSADGKRMVFESSRTGKRVLWAKDLTTGKEWPLTDVASMENLPIISNDGSEVVYLLTDGFSAAMHVIPFEGGPPRNVCNDCWQPFQWTSDRSSVVFGADNPPHIGLLNVATGQKTDLARHPAYRIWSAYLDATESWAILAMQRDRDRPIRWFLAPVRQAAAAPESAWIPLPSGDNTRWSPDGNLLYFVSDQDGSTCLYTQRLDPVSKRPEGPACPLQHFHMPSRTLLEDPAWRGVSIARDKMLLALRELTGNIWMAESKQN